MDSRAIFFTEDFDYTPSDQPWLTIAYTKGSTCVVDEECEEKAIARGHATYSDFAEDELFALEGEEFSVEDDD